MSRTDTIIIGAGQAGLALSYCLRERGIDHVVLERGGVGQRWLEQRDTLRLLTPNWLTRLPGAPYRGPDPDGFMRACDVADYLDDYARGFAAQVQEQTSVLAVARTAGGYRVSTTRGCWSARAVVIATGYCDGAAVPALARDLPRDLVQLSAATYRSPAQLPDGGVLIVGASATGVQLADEIQRSGRPVTLAVGRHTRVPRRYRGRDIFFWLDRMGVLDQRLCDVRDPQAALREPSLQLVGERDAGALDLAALQARGVRLTGRALHASGGRIVFADDLPASTRAADAKLARLLDRIDAFAAARGLGGEIADGDAIRPAALRLNAVRPPNSLHLRANGIRTVLWATGYTRRYPWLHVDVLDAHGELRHDGGITPAPGLYALGLRFQRTRKSTFIGGVGDDARAIAEHIADHLGARRRAA